MLISASLTRQAEPTFTWRLDLYARSAHAVTMNSLDVIINRLQVDLQGEMKGQLTPFQNATKDKMIYGSLLNRYRALSDSNARAFRLREIHHCTKL